MCAVARDEAVNVLTNAVTDAPTDELVEFYNELFPDEPISEADVQHDTAPLVGRIVAHIECGLEIEEIVDLWNVVFPRHHHVEFDEVTQSLQYSDEAESFQLAD